MSAKPMTPEVAALSRKHEEACRHIKSLERADKILADVGFIHSEAKQHVLAARLAIARTIGVAGVVAHDAFWAFIRANKPKPEPTPDPAQ